MKKFLIIDGNAILHRAYHALPPLQTKTGELVNAVYGFAMILFKVLKDIRPEYAALTFDKAKRTFRHDEFKEYKANRVKQPDELYSQLDRIKELGRALNIKIFEIDGYEADDIIGTLCEKEAVDNDEVKSIILTGDMDTMQLVDDNTEVCTFKKGVSETIVYDEAAVVERYGLKPAQMIDYKALRGDQSDNIPGVKGIGEKTAVELLKEFGTLEKIYQAMEKDDQKIKPRIIGLLKEHREMAIMSKKLATIVRDVPDLNFELEACRLGDFDRQLVIELLVEFGFKSLLNKIPEFGAPAADFSQPAENKRSGDGIQQPLGMGLKRDNQVLLPGYRLINDDESFAGFFKELTRQPEFAIDTETTSLDTMAAELVGLSFSWRIGEAYYLNYYGHHNFLEKLKPILEDEKVKKFGHNIKYDCKILKNHGVELRGITFDSMVASYLLNPGTRQHSLDNLAFTELGHEMVSYEDLVGKGKNQIKITEVDLIALANYAAEDADYTFQLVNKLRPELVDKELFGLFSELEMPLIKVLAAMELNGIKIDDKFLNKLSKKLDERLEKLDGEIIKLAGMSFNIDSPSQLKKVLFEKLNLSVKGLKKSKTGISTAAGELDKLIDSHPIIKLVIEHRELSKLQSTYLKALPELINRKTGRVHTSFNQTVTATGRLSSSDPNLQNIPIRTELGAEVRKAFVAEKGYKILAADYSQIELRIVASLADDKYMQEIFQAGKDIHAATAAKIHNVELDQVTKEMRYAAKTVNFGVLYGQGANALAAQTGLTYAEAKDFIEKYFASFPAVKKYIEATKDLAHRDGFVETLLGRKRYIPDINSSVQMIKAAAERVAVNTPIQGTAADLIKLAMIEIHSALKKYPTDQVKMLLQVHDELVFEVREDLVPEIGRLVQEKMENIYKLRAPIKVEVEVGDNWGELK